MIKVTFHRTYFMEDDVVFEAGDIPRDNVQTDTYEADDAEEAATWIRREGLSFAATGSDWAANPDGTRIVDYRTGERAEESAHIEGATEAEFDEIIRLVDGL